jgi:CRP-like cAMP-binding protein
MTLHLPDILKILPLPFCPEGISSPKGFSSPEGFEVRDYGRNEHFLIQGDYPAYLGFVMHGIFREYFSGSNKKEYNLSFCAKGDLAGPYHVPQSANPQSVDPSAGPSVEPSVEPSAVSVQALTPGSLLLIPLHEFGRLILTDTAWLNAAREIAHRLLIKKFERENQLLTLSALERYDLLEQRYPQLIQQIPAYHIASYLGITPISLSRLRSRRF